MGREGRGEGEGEGRVHAIKIFSFMSETASTAMLPLHVSKTVIGLDIG